MGLFPQLAPPNRWMTGGGAAVWGRWMETKYHVPGRGGKGTRHRRSFLGKLIPTENPPKSEISKLEPGLPSQGRRVKHTEFNRSLA